MAAVSAQAQLPATVASPDGKNVVTVLLDNGTLKYAVRRGGANVIAPRGSQTGASTAARATLGATSHATTNVASVTTKRKICGRISAA